MARKSELGPLDQRVSILVPRRTQHQGTGEGQVQYLLWQKAFAEVKSAGAGGESIENYVPVATRAWRVRLRYHSRLIGREAQSFVLIWQTWFLQVQKVDDFDGKRRFVWLTCEAIE